MCQELHREIARLPFEINPYILYIATPSAQAICRDFANSLSDSQRGAIRAVAVDTEGIGGILSAFGQRFDTVMTDATVEDMVAPFHGFTGVYSIVVIARKDVDIALVSSHSPLIRAALGLPAGAQVQVSLRP